MVQEPFCRLIEGWETTLVALDVPGLTGFRVSVPQMTMFTLVGSNILDGQLIGNMRAAPARPHQFSVLD
jgi:hypothetical protein